MKSQAVSATPLEETLSEYVRREIAASNVLPGIDFVVFSGKANDWKKDGNAIYLRCRRTRLMDPDTGESPEFWGRLFAPAGVFVIPDVETEMLAIVPPEIDGPGAGWVFHGAQLPPQAVTQEIARWTMSKATTLAANAGGWCFFGGPAGHESFIAIDKDTGDIQASTLGRMRLAISPSNGAIELQLTDNATPNSTVKACIRMDETGIHLSAGAAAINIGSDGSIRTIGSQPIYLMHPGGVLGGAATTPIGKPGAPSLPSLGWFMSG